MTENGSCNPGFRPGPTTGYSAWVRSMVFKACSTLKHVPNAANLNVLMALNLPSNALKTLKFTHIKTYPNNFVVILFNLTGCFLAFFGENLVPFENLRWQHWVRRSALSKTWIPYSETWVIVHVIIPKNFKYCRKAPYSGYRGFWVWRIQILMEASSPRTRKASKWRISNMAARRTADF